MRTESLKEFIADLKNRLLAQENSLGALETRPITKDEDIHGLLKAIPQAHINELEFVIEELERILDEG
jgi:hypothetical protein